MRRVWLVFATACSSSDANDAAWGHVLDGALVSATADGSGGAVVAVDGDVVRLARDGAQLWRQSTGACMPSDAVALADGRAVVIGRDAARSCNDGRPPAPCWIEVDDGGNGALAYAGDPGSTLAGLGADADGAFAIGSVGSAVAGCAAGAVTVNATTIAGPATFAARLDAWVAQPGSAVNVGDLGEDGGACVAGANFAARYAKDGSVQFAMPTGDTATPRWIAAPASGTCVVAGGLVLELGGADGIAPVDSDLAIATHANGRTLAVVAGAQAISADIVELTDRYKRGATLAHVIGATDVRASARGDELLVSGTAIGTVTFTLDGASTETRLDVTGTQSYVFGVMLR